MSKYIKQDDVFELARTGVLVNNGSFESVCKYIGSLPTIEVSEDCISREYLEEQLQQIEDITAMVHIDLGEDPYDEAEEIVLPIRTVKKIFKNAPSVIPQVPNEDAISKAYFEQKIENQIMTVEKDEEYWQGWNNALDKVIELVEDAPSVVPTTENEIKLCRNCDNAYLYQDCLYCDEIEEETEIEPNDTCSLWKLRENAPSVIPKPREGEWIYRYAWRMGRDYYPAKYECNQCHHYVAVASDKNYCPNCGAKMRDDNVEDD